jgi:hypothetical protein
MRIQRLLSIIVLLLICFQASAITTPVRLYPVLEDTTLGTLPVVRTTTPAQSKKPGLFGKLKDKLLLLVINRQLKEEKASARSILGWVSLGMIVLSLGLLAFAAGGGAAGVGLLFLAGLVTGLVSLFLPRNKQEKAAKKKNTGGIIALVLGIGAVLALIIAFAGSSWH